MKGKTAAIIAASTIALLGACANPQAQESPATPREQQQNHELADDPAATAKQALEDAMRKTASERDALRAANTPRPPGPAADFPPAPTVPPIPADKLRADILRLIESIRTPDDTNREHVDRIMGVTMGKAEDTDMEFAYRGTTEEGWIYGLQVRPERVGPGLKILFRTASKGISERRPEQCTYDFEELTAELEILGYQRHAERPWRGGGEESWGFHTRMHPTKTAVAIGVYVYRMDQSRREGPFCIHQIDIICTQLKDET